MTSLGLSLGLVRPAAVVAVGAEILTAIAWKAAFWAEDPDWTPPSDGAAVASWRDAGSEAKNAESVGAAQPTYRASTAAFGSRPTVQFAGSPQSLTTVNWTTAIDAATAVTWVVVASAAASTNQVFIGSNTNASSDHYLSAHSTNQWNMFRGGSGDRGGVTNTSPHLIIGVMNGSSGSGTIEVDGTLVKSIAGSGSATLPGVCLGKFPETRYLIGHLAFAGVLSGSISAGDRTLIEEWAADTYGLTIA